MQEYEYITGGNAPGFPHIFAGTRRPANIFVGHLHARLIWGELEQSAYSPVQGTTYYSSALESGTRRFATGTVLVFEPRGVPGLELGVARFFHSLWPKEGLPRSYFTKPLQGIFKKGLPQQEGLGQSGGSDNQLASAFARWILPKSGFEFYGEYGREDHSWDRRDFVQEPDHSRTYGLGLRKVLGSITPEGFSAIRAELIDYELPTLARNRSEGGIFIHSVIFQGHTNRGQLIGADAGVGTGGASSLIWERYGRNRKLSIGWSRTVRQENGVFFVTGVENQRSVDVLHALNVEYTRESRGFELTTGASLAREFNRYFSSDATNFNTIVSIRRRFGR
jgi:hypothetical protein